jgi:hypothetical protein
VDARTRRLLDGPIGPSLLALPDGRVTFEQALLVLVDPEGTAP